MKKNSLIIIAFVLSFGAFIALRFSASSSGSYSLSLNSLFKTISQSTHNASTSGADKNDSEDAVSSTPTPTPTPISTATPTPKPTSVATVSSGPIAVDKSLTKPSTSSDDNDTDDNIVESDSSDDFGLLNDTWHGDFTPKRKFSGELPRIICWGDSLTETLDLKTAYPDVLRALTGCEVLNYGLSYETTNMIAMRSGGIEVTVDATVIPSTCDMIPIFLKSETGNNIYLLEYGDAGVNPCSIAGIEGTLRRINDSYYFTRSTEGERTSIDEGTPLITFAQKDAQKDDVLILFTGTNDLPNPQTIYDIIDTQHKMIESAGCTKYLVIGLTYNDGIDDLSSVNSILANEYEDHFLDIRSYLLNYGIQDAHLKATSADMIDISKGNMPASLMKDYVHGNKYYYDLLAKQIYRRLIYLGYLPQD